MSFVEYARVVNKVVAIYSVYMNFFFFQIATYLQCGLVSCHVSFTELVGAAGLTQDSSF